MHLTDHELLETLNFRSPIAGSENGAGGHALFQYDDSTVFKCRIKNGPANQQWEALTYQFIRAHTTIPVPRVYRVISYEFSHLIFMDYIPGERLDSVWPTLSIWQKCHVAWTLRGYVRQLRAIRGQFALRPGPLGGPDPRICRGPMWPDCEDGPFDNFATFYRKARRYVLGVVDDLNDERTSEEYRQAEKNLVFTHNDLNMRNVIIGEDGQLWLIDWDWSGFYPVYFEYVSSALASKCSAIQAPLSWEVMVPFISSPFFKEGHRLESFPWR